MALGYQGLILLEDKLFLVTDGNLDHVRPEIVSEGTYAAPDVNTAVNRVHVFDLDDINGGFNFNANIELIDHLFNLNDGWVTHRDVSQSLVWYSNVVNNFEFGDAYWTRISLSAGSGNMLSTSIDMTMIPGAFPNIDDKYTLPTRHLQLSDNYIDQRFGLDNGGEEQLLPNISFASPPEQLPIPYWKTSIEFIDENDEGLPEGVYVYNWAIELVNGITRRNLCTATNETNDHPGPSLIQVGMAGVTLNVTFVTVVSLDETGTPITEFNMPERFKDVIIKIIGPTEDLTREISLGRIDASEDGNEFSNPVQEISDASNISGIGALQEMNYIAQGYFTMPHIKELP